MGIHKGYFAVETVFKFSKVHYDYATLFTTVLMSFLFSLSLQEYEWDKKRERVVIITYYVYQILKFFIFINVRNKSCFHKSNYESHSSHILFDVIFNYIFVLTWINK